MTVKSNRLPIELGQELTIDASASDIFSNLQFGAMGLVVARKGNW